ncbi:3-hydroxyacyl-CoA dehydrogenase [Egicoccus halophilus]|uniref:Putative oxidoreductase n=1 Tax=Egicoccus halophilus TaxID=1670830 RepID=A0A8J3A9T2_9ACTN|nr:3-hydroxyacyl-CoA dehydrogenase [Egicoccus halophilus]GGI05566.1 putative oxidoreductase [Egicoccus halophilus]
MQLTDRSVALVTGGASGLGNATARALHAKGAHVLLLDLPSADGDAAAEQVGERARFVPTDVTDPDAVSEAIAQASEVGELRVAVNCAGVGWASRVLGKQGPHDLELFRKVVEVNLIGTFNVLRLAAQAMAYNEPDDGDRGVIVNTASIAAFDGQIGQAAYSASKGGVAGLTLPVARDLARHQIRVCTIAPGTFDTPMLAGLPAEARTALAEDIPHPHRLGRPDEFGLLASQIVENSYLNGEVIRLDGSLRMAPR